MGMEDGHTIHVRVDEGDSCTWGAKLECKISPTLYAATIVTFAGSAMYFALYFFFLMRSWRQLSSQLYQKYRILNLAVRLQVRPRPPPLPPRMHAFSSAPTQVPPPPPRSGWPGRAANRGWQQSVGAAGCLSADRQRRPAHAAVCRVPCMCCTDLRSIRKKTACHALEPYIGANCVLHMNGRHPRQSPPPPPAAPDALLLLQFRFNGSMVLSLIFGMALTWYLGSDACVNFTVTWFGNPPVTFIIVMFQVCPPTPLPAFWQHSLLSHSPGADSRPRGCPAQPRRKLHHIASH